MRGLAAERPAEPSGHDRGLVAAQAVGVEEQRVLEEPDHDRGLAVPQPRLDRGRGEPGRPLVEPDQDRGRRPDAAVLLDPRPDAREAVRRAAPTNAWKSTRFTGATNRSVGAIGVASAA